MRAYATSVTSLATSIALLVCTATFAPVAMTITLGVLALLGMAGVAFTVKGAASAGHISDQ